MVKTKRRINPKINERKSKELPISYSNLSVDQFGKLCERAGKKNDFKDKLAKRIVCGYGVIWGSKNDYGEIFVKGCCAKSIADMGPDSNSTYKIKFRDRHGKSVSLFAKLVEDDIGLYFESLPLDNVRWADDLLTQLESGTINNFSIGFKHCWNSVEWDEDNDAMINMEIRLFEISAVDIPSDLATYAERSAEERECIEEDVEEFITTLPRSKQLEARKIFTRCMTLHSEEPLESRKQALKKEEKQSVKKGKGLDLIYITKNF